MINTIYIEENVKEHPRTKNILSRFKVARHIYIDRYGELFNRRNQNFRIQKHRPDLILANKHQGFVLPTPEGFGFTGSKNYYFSHMYNCIYDCRYCFLQGLYRSANLVLFVNYEDFDKEIIKLVEANKGEQVNFFSGYDCDSLALENVTGFATHILPIFKKLPSALIEFRTKSIQVRPLLSIPVIENCVVAYSLVPDIISQKVDLRAPTIEQRIQTMVKLANAGWKIGLRFDPLIHGRDWKNLYECLLNRVFNLIPNRSIHSISYGALRFPRAMFKTITKLYPKDKLLSSKLNNHNAYVSYSAELETEMIEFCRELSIKFVSEEKIFKCSSQ